jgi:hypothetical protein
MSSKQQMRRGKNQSLYKYLPETWIDFSVRGKERKQYIAKVLRWNSEKLDGINSKRLIRTVNESIRSFENQAVAPGPIKPTVGFGAELTKDNCDVLTPKASDEERGIVAQISPLTFYCKLCNKVYQFNSEEEYQKRRYCTNPECHHAELAQFRQIYFCKCGYATDRHNPRCPEHGYQYIKWYGNFDFICTKCKRPIPMQVKCPVCGDMLRPKVALDPAQFFVFSLSLIDLIDEKLENFISGTEYGPYITFAYWLGLVSKEELDEIIKNGIVSDPEVYRKLYDEMYQQMLPLGEVVAAQAAKIAADQQCGNRFNDIVNDLKTKIFTGESDLSSIAERILEYDLVTRLDDVSDLASAVNVARLLNTNANPEQYAQIAERFGIKSARVCDRIPFVSCSYGYTRVESEWKEGVQLHALKEEKNGRKNIYATKLNTEGVLFEFDRKKIIQWLIANEIINVDEAPNLDSKEEIKIWFLNNIKPSLIHPFSTIDEKVSKKTYYVYRLIHSLSHLLIRAAADIGGLGKDSLSEYIFPGVPAVLIYCQNSQGFNLGSLFNTFEAYFDKWMNKAYTNAQKCIFDPICIERQKACTGCLFVNEVSCQHFNKDLDRALVVGHVDRETQRKTTGFWEE